MAQANNALPAICTAAGTVLIGAMMCGSGASDTALAMQVRAKTEGTAEARSARCCIM